MDLREYARRMTDAFTQIQDGKICKGCMHIEEKDAIPPSNGKFSAVSLKGVNRFAQVTENLRHFAALNPDAVELKYIIYEKNNQPAEIDKFLAFAQDATIKNIQISFNFLEQNINKVSEKSIMAAALMLVKAFNTDLNINTFFMPPDLLAKIKGYINNA